MDSGTQHRSELELAADALDNLFSVVGAARRRAERWGDKAARAQRAARGDELPETGLEIGADGDPTSAGSNETGDMLDAATVALRDRDLTTLEEEYARYLDPLDPPEQIRADLEALNESLHTFKIHALFDEDGALELAVEPEEGGWYLPSDEVVDHLTGFQDIGDSGQKMSWPAVAHTPCVWPPGSGDPTFIATALPAEVYEAMRELPEQVQEQVLERLGVETVGETARTVRVGRVDGGPGAAARADALAGVQASDIPYLLGQVPYGSAAAMYLAGQPDDTNTVHVASGDGSRVAIQQVSDGWEVSREVVREDFAGDIGAKEFEDAVTWLGGNVVEGKEYRAWMPITDDLSVNVEDIAQDRVSPRLSEARIFESPQLTAEQVREAARAQRTIAGPQAKDLPDGVYAMPWGAAGFAGGVKYREVNLSDGRIAGVWTTGGAATRHPEGVPSVVMDKDRNVIAAGHFENGRATGEWSFTDENREFFAEKATLDPNTGRASDVHTRASEDEPFTRRPELDGTRMFRDVNSAGFGGSMKSALADAKASASAGAPHPVALAAKKVADTTSQVVDDVTDTTAMLMNGMDSHDPHQGPRLR